MIITSPSIDVSAQQVEIWEMTNEYRESMGLPGLDLNPVLNSAADHRINDIIERHTLSHDGFNDFIKDERYFKSISNRQKEVVYTGENLACGYDSMKQAFEKLIESPLHRKNILDKRYRSMGISVVKNKVRLPNGKCKRSNKFVIVQLFGSR